PTSTRACRSAGATTSSQASGQAITAHLDGALNVPRSESFHWFVLFHPATAQSLAILKFIALSPSPIGSQVWTGSRRRGGTRSPRDMLNRRIAVPCGTLGQ